MQHQETIAAIATATGRAGISCVRISGPAAYAVAAAVFTPATPPQLGRGKGIIPHFTAVFSRGGRRME